MRDTPTWLKQNQPACDESSLETAVVSMAPISAGFEFQGRVDWTCDSGAWSLEFAVEGSGLLPRFGLQSLDL